MAKAKDLAGLAALAGLGYMLSNQSRNKVDLTETKDSNPTRAARPVSTETRPDVRTDFGGAGDEMSNVRRDVSSGDEMSKYAASYKPPAPKPAPKPAPVKDVDPYANYEGGDLLTGAKLRTQPASNVADAVRNEEAAKSVAKAAQVDANRAANAGDNKAATTKYSEATDQYKNLSRAAAVTNARKKEAKLSRRSPGDEMSDYAAKQAALRDARANEMQRETRGQVRNTAYAKPTLMKKGGSVSKVSSASSRADGIATKGKTRGKIC
jgi:hypothetical protein